MTDTTTDKNGTGYTQGPWQALPTGHGGIIGPRWEVRAGNISVADLRDNGHNRTHGAANARLIAAAPELYEAVVLLLSSRSHHPDQEVVERRVIEGLNKGLAALAKARGQD